jgi:hypothetical protein
MGGMVQSRALKAERLDQPRHHPFPRRQRGQASICKIGRDPQVNLLTEGPEGLRALAATGHVLGLCVRPDQLDSDDLLPVMRGKGVPDGHVVCGQVLPMVLLLCCVMTLSAVQAAQDT